MVGRSIFCERILLSVGGAENVRVSTDAACPISADKCANGSLRPELFNPGADLRQQVMAEPTNAYRSSDENFWAWCGPTHGLASAMMPDDVGVISSKLYSELSGGGVSRIVDFDYAYHAGGRQIGGRNRAIESIMH